MNYKTRSKINYSKNKSKKNLTNFLIIIIGGFIYTLILPLVNTMFLIILQTAIPIDKQGRVMSFVMVMVTLVTPLGMIISGPLVEILGIGNLFILSITMEIIFLSIIWFFTKLRKTDFKTNNE